MFVHTDIFKKTCFQEQCLRKVFKRNYYRLNGQAAGQLQETDCVSVSFRHAGEKDWHIKSRMNTIYSYLL